MQNVRFITQKWAFFKGCALPAHWWLKPAFANMYIGILESSSMQDSDKIISPAFTLSHERGPIRPPSESSSLLLRVSRNCPWNRCSFCPVYKGAGFGKRPLHEVKSDIKVIHDSVSFILNNDEKTTHTYDGTLSPETLSAFFKNRNCSNSFRAVALWLSQGADAVFLQDADPLAAPPDESIELVRHLRKHLPFVKRITAYARSRTMAAWKPEKLVELKQAGVTRIHSGIESGNAHVLKEVCKGVTPDIQIKGGRNVRATGLEQSLYVMPGLGGRRFSSSHVRDTAEVIEAIRPTFLRLRSLFVIPGTELFSRAESGTFTPLDEIETVNEIKKLLEKLKGCRIRIESDHTANLLENINGRLPDDYRLMRERIDEFEQLSGPEKELFIIGKRAGVFRAISDMNHPQRRMIADAHLRKMKHMKLTCANYIRLNSALHL